MDTDGELEPVERSIRVATSSQFAEVVELLRSSGRWAEERGFPLMWEGPELEPRVRTSVEAGATYVLLGPDRKVYATVALEWDDPPIWGSRPPDAGYVHRLAVRREWAGRQVGRRLVDWAEREIARRGRRWLRLDTIAANPVLCRYYEALGFRRVGDSRFRGIEFARFERIVRSAADVDRGPSP